MPLLDSPRYAGPSNGPLFLARRPRSSRLWPLCGCCAVGLLVLLARPLATTMPLMSHMQAAFAISFGAGMSTGIGACLVLFVTAVNPLLLSSTLAFSAGVMMYVSLVEVAHAPAVPMCTRAVCPVRARCPCLFPCCLPRARCHGFAPLARPTSRP